MVHKPKRRHSTVKKKLIFGAALSLTALVIFVMGSILIAKYSGKPVPPPNIPRETQTAGKGPQLTYVVMGDSTSIGQGADYKDSYAQQSFTHLADKYKVKFINVGVSGATTKDVYDKQLTKAESYKPDLVLLAVGANDARHFKDSDETRIAAQKIISGLRKTNCDVRIVVTGSPAMDSVPRFPWLIKKVMAHETHRVNDTFESLVRSENLTMAPIADKTRSAFLADPTLFAQDKFHPNARGYALWTPVVNNALNEALELPTPDKCLPEIIHLPAMVQ